MNKEFLKKLGKSLLRIVAALAIILGVQLFLAGFLGELINRNSTDRNKYLIDEKL